MRDEQEKINKKLEYEKARERDNETHMESFKVS